MKTGKIKNVAALDKVVQICNAHGASYNPSKASLQPTALRSLLELAQEKSKAVIDTRMAYALAVNARKESIGEIPKLAAKVVRMVSASDASLEDRKQVRLIMRKFYAVRKKKPEDESTSTQGIGEQPGKKRRSISMRDRDGIMTLFEELVHIVRRMPGYNPNEPEFKVEGLEAVLAKLKSQCHAATLAAISYSNARIARELLVFGPEGVVESTREAKDYIRAKFGVRSMQSEQTRPSMYF